ncbi:MAG TPA: hypothetical protein VI319_16930 [Burkholderiales bacterium]
MSKKGGGGGKSVTVALHAENKSGETGRAKLTPMGDKTRVELSLKGTPKGVAQPAHIHEGSCAKLDPKPKYPLSNVVDGKSTSEVPVKMEELMEGNMAVNVHKSGDEIKTYVACGDLKTRKGKSKM